VLVATKKQAAVVQDTLNVSILLTQDLCADYFLRQLKHFVGVDVRVAIVGCTNYSLVLSI
jgi:hypothetical protein